MPILRPAGIRTVVAVASAKGGVGKSAICVNLAAALAMAGRKVAIVDADLNSPGVLGMLGLKPLRRFAPGEEIDPASGPLGIRAVASSQLADGEPAAFSFIEADETPSPALSHNGARPLEIDYRAALRRLIGARFGPLDLMLIDLGSGLAQLHRLAEVIELTGVVMVTRPSEAAVRATHDALKIIAHDGIAMLGLVENMLGFNCDSCHTVRPLFPQGNFTGLAHTLEAPILGRLPFDPRLADCAERGALFVREHPDAPLSKQFAAIAANLEQELVRRAAAEPLATEEPA
ncbi:MAG TPA: P-loop NTPase [Candidatus Binataceae bacterium]|nr:P-loop NTPase [Candidatus Binataceae bacterium]